MPTDSLEQRFGTALMEAWELSKEINQALGRLEVADPQRVHVMNMLNIKGDLYNAIIKIRGMVSSIESLANERKPDHGKTSPR